DETLEWLTGVEASRNRTEHRIEQREKPRRILEYRALIHGPETSLFESAVFGWADRLFALPLWMEQSNLAAAVEFGDLELQVDTADRSFEADGLLMLYKSAAVYEAVEIESV